MHIPTFNKVPMSLWHMWVWVGMSLSVFGGNSSYKEKEIDSIRYVIFYEGMSPHVHVKNQ